MSFFNCLIVAVILSIPLIGFADHGSSGAGEGFIVTSPIPVKDGDTEYGAVVSTRYNPSSEEYEVYTGGQLLFGLHKSEVDIDAGYTNQESGRISLSASYLRQLIEDHTTWGNISVRAQSGLERLTEEDETVVNLSAAILFQRALTHKTKFGLNVGFAKQLNSPTFSEEAEAGYHEEESHGDHHEEEEHHHEEDEHHEAPEEDHHGLVTELSRQDGFYVSGGFTFSLDDHTDPGHEHDGIEQNLFVSARLRQMRSERGERYISPGAQVGFQRVNLEKNRNWNLSLGMDREKFGHENLGSENVYRFTVRFSKARTRR